MLTFKRKFRRLKVNTKMSSPTPEGREGEWKYGYIHSYHRHLKEVRGQPHAQPTYPLLKSRHHTWSRKLREPDWKFSQRGKILLTGGTRTPGRLKCLTCEEYGMEGATTCLLTLYSISSRNAFAVFLFIS